MNDTSGVAAIPSPQPHQGQVARSGITFPGGTASSVVFGTSPALVVSASTFPSPPSSTAEPPQSNPSSNPFAAFKFPPPSASFDASDPFGSGSASGSGSGFGSPSPSVPSAHQFPPPDALASGTGGHGGGSSPSRASTASASSAVASVPTTLGGPFGGGGATTGPTAARFVDPFPASGGSTFGSGSGRTFLSSTGTMTAHGDGGAQRSSAFGLSSPPSSPPSPPLPSSLFAGRRLGSAPTTAPTPFSASSSSVASTAPGGSTFGGATTATPSAPPNGTGNDFVITSSSAFGSTSRSPAALFGAQTNAAPFGTCHRPTVGGVFGSPAPVPNTSTTLGAAASSFFGTRPNAAPPSGTTGGGDSTFGTAAVAAVGGDGAGLFGSPVSVPTTTSSSSPGAPYPPAFGARTYAAAQFGAPPGGFASPPPAPTSTFGPGGPTFGCSTSPTNFGYQPPVASAPAFGAPMPAGTAAVPYQVTSKNDGTAIINIQSITAMPAYESKSMEELRLEDYSNGNRGTMAFGPGGLTFGSTSPTNFGSQPPTAASASSSVGVFGGGLTTPPFGASVGIGTGPVPTGTAAVPYQATSKNDGTAVINLQSITAMPAYGSKSVEELRLEDYSNGNLRTAMDRQPTSSTAGFGGAATTPRTTGGPSPSGQGSPEVDVDETCLICMTEERNATIVHGETGHFVCCLTCARRLKARGQPCPVCRLPIDLVIQQFKS